METPGYVYAQREVKKTWLFAQPVSGAMIYDVVLDVMLHLKRIIKDIHTN